MDRCQRFQSMYTQYAAENNRLGFRLFDFATKTPSSPPHAVNLTDQLQQCAPLPLPFFTHFAAGSGEVGEKGSLVGRLG